LSKSIPKQNWKSRLHRIIYEADTREGKIFDLIIVGAIIFSIVLVMLESVKDLDAKYHTFFNVSEWVITILFTIEYVVRIISVKKPSSYIFSFYGIIDFLSTIPKYLSLFIGGAARPINAMGPAKAVMTPVKRLVAIKIKFLVF